MGTLKFGGVVRARGGISVGAGATTTLTDATTAAGNTAILYVPHSTAVGTVQTVNGVFLVGQRAAGSPCLITRMNGTTYYAALTVA